MTTSCQLCLQKVHYDDLKIHILTEKHRSVLLNRMKQQKVTATKHLLDKACRVYGEDTHINSDSPQNADNDRPAQFKFNFAPPIRTFYDQLIVNECYPDDITSQIDDIPIYTIQIKDERDAYCLLCKCRVEDRLPSIKIHLRGSRHQNNAADNELLRILDAYHTAFIRLTPEFQAHVIYFLPVSLTKVKCSLCIENYVRCDSLEAHILSHGHREALMKRSKGGIFKKKRMVVKRALEVYGNDEENGERSDEMSSPTINGIGRTFKCSRDVDTLVDLFCRGEK